MARTCAVVLLTHFFSTGQNNIESFYKKKKTIIDLRVNRLFRNRPESDTEYGNQQLSRFDTLTLDRVCVAQETRFHVQNSLRMLKPINVRNKRFVLPIVVLVWQKISPNSLLLHFQSFFFSRRSFVICHIYFLCLLNNVTVLLCFCLCEVCVPNSRLCRHRHNWTANYVIEYCLARYYPWVIQPLITIAWTTSQRHSERKRANYTQNETNISSSFSFCFRSVV